MIWPNPSRLSLSTLAAGLCLLLCFSTARAQPHAGLRETEYRLVKGGNQPLKLAHGFCDPESFSVQVNGDAWVRGQDYRVRARSGFVVPLRPWQTSSTSALQDSLVNPTDQALVIISYIFQPVAVPSRMDLREVGTPPGVPQDSLGSGSRASDGPYFVPEKSMDDWRRGNLQVTGSKTVQVSSGNRREMTVDQNLRLNIVGQLTEDIAVRAFLSDDNLPVIPQGNTEELRDIDKVLVEMTAPGWKATLGDFVARRQGSTFGDYRRKLQGFSLTATPGNSTVEVLAGSPRGLYRTLQIRGQESNQGPYYLGGGSGGENLFIVAGSERVTLNGETLTRGQDRDYVIDYVRGTVTFSYRRLITAESTIVVEFEEGEGPYGRTVVGAGAGTSFEIPGLNLPGSFSARMIREKDDPGRLRTGELAAEDEAVLAAAGDDPLLAIASGVSLREPGEGQYDLSVVGSDTTYVYNAEGGDYDVSFFYVGPGRGHYTLDSLTETGVKVFVYQGSGQGSYLIGRPLDRPTMQSLATLQAAVGDTTGNHVRAEWNFGNDDQNQLSDLDNDDNQGNAGRIEASIPRQDLTWNDRSLGQARLLAFWETKDAQFRPFQVRQTVFDFDNWGLADRARRTGFLDEANTEAGVDLGWKLGRENQRLELKTNLGSLSHGENLEADRFSGALNWNFRGGRGRHSLQEAHASDTIDPLDINHVNRSHQLEWAMGPVVPSVGYQMRRWEDGKIGPGRAAGFRYEEVGTGIKSSPASKVNWRLDFKRGLADSLVAGQWSLQRDSRTFTSGVTTDRVAGMRLVGEGTMRRILAPGLPEQTTRLARLNLSGDWKPTATSWSLGYRVDNSRTEVLDRQVIFVGDNQGDFNQDGDFVGQGQGDHNMVLAGTDSLVATTAVLADLNWRQGFQWLGKDRWFSSWNALTVVSLEGRSTTDDIGGLLTLDPAVIFADESTVLDDLHFTEELTLLQHLKNVDLRARFDYRETKDRQYADHPEDRLKRDFQLNSNLNVSARSSVRLRWSRLNENRFSTETGSSSRRSYLSTTQKNEAGWNFRPSADLRLGIQGEYLTRQDQVSGVSQKEYALRPNLRQRVKRQWTIQADLRLADVQSDEPAGSQRPWFYSYPGRNVESTLRLSWEPSQYLTVAANWFARKQGDRRWQHDLRLESTARF